LYNPVPIVRSSSFYKNYWEGYSPKLGRDVCFLGQLNYEFWLLLEINHEIVSFCERPKQITGVHNRKKYDIIPNFWVRNKNGRESFILIDERGGNKPKQSFVFFEEWCEQNSKNLTVIKKEDLLDKQILVNNSKRILPYLAKNNPIEIDVFKVNQIIKKEKQTITNIIDQLHSSISSQRVIEVIYYLIYHNKVSSNIYERLIGVNTEVWLHCQEEE
jgi:hypothetical protein